MNNRVAAQRFHPFSTGKMRNIAATLLALIAAADKLTPAPDKKSSLLASRYPVKARTRSGRRRTGAGDGAARRALLGETVRTPPVWCERPASVEGRRGERTAVECSLLPLRDRGGSVGHIAVAFRDVTAETEVARLRALR